MPPNYMNVMKVEGDLVELDIRGLSEYDLELLRSANCGITENPDGHTVAFPCTTLWGMTEESMAGAVNGIMVHMIGDSKVRIESRK